MLVYHMERLYSLFESLIELRLCSACLSVPPDPPRPSPPTHAQIPNNPQTPTVPSRSPHVPFLPEPVYLSSTPRPRSMSLEMVCQAAQVPFIFRLLRAFVIAYLCSTLFPTTTAAIPRPSIPDHFTCQLCCICL